ncbi:MAG TPA: alpha-L-fucosidase [Clostridiales bacterium]|nr:alpha-L-fucosidase [Clostridiales bacterium]
MENKLWYNSIPKEWMEGLPIGNGRLAAMIWGNEDTDQISLNHEWLWRGENRTRDNEQVSDHLQEVRDCLKRGDFFRATSLANAYFGGLGGISGLPHRTDPYQPAGDLKFILKDCTRFCRRELDIVECTASVERLTAASPVTSVFIAHPKYNLIICRWNSSSGKFSGKFQYSRVYDAKANESCHYSDSGISYSCTFQNGISFKTVVTIKTDGIAKAETDGVSIENAASITAFINIAASVRGIQEELAMYPVPDLEWDDLLASHKEAFARLLGRLSLNLSLPESTLPTDERIFQVRTGAEDPGLLLLYFNFGRYLLASSSICGELPANLQGKWNDRIDPPWECDYHLNINLQMNYWMAEAANMHECAEALIKYIERFVPHARKAAHDLYGCRGIWLPHSTDAWGRATPEGYGWAVWVGAAPWIAQHFWNHYEYSGNIDFLKNRAYPFFKEVALFFEDYLVEDETGIYQIMPSQSPENRFAGTGYWPVSIGISAAMDVQLVFDALGYAIKSAEILGVDAEAREKWKSIIEHLPPFKIGSDGRLLEWDIERHEAEPGHRHLSHLYGLFPSDIFNPIDRPAQYEAAIKSLQFRLSQGGGHTGWSRAWVACLFARIGQGDELWKHLYALLTDFATVSLLDLHPPRIFQIDGNLGAVEAILQALVQCWGGKVHLLRALPTAWPKGSIKGIKTKGGHTLDLSWSDGKLDKIDIVIGYSERIVLSGLAGKVQLAENIAEIGEDVVVTGNCGTKVSMLIESQQP